MKVRARRRLGPRCEAVSSTRRAGMRCLHRGRFQHDGHAVCGNHIPKARAGSLRYIVGPIRKPLAGVGAIG